MNFNLIHRGKLRPLAFLCELNKGQKEKEKKMDYKLNKNYFAEKIKIPVKFYLIAIVVLVILFMCKPVIATILLVVGGLLAFALHGKKPTDSEIDAQAASFLEGVKSRAFMKLGVDEEEVSIAEPIEFWGYAFDGVLADDANRQALNICGKDGKWRSSEVFIGGFYFSENVVHYYYKIASLVSDATKEGTEEYFYKDIVSVKTESGDKPFKDPKTGVEDDKRRVRYEGFVLRNTGGESTSCWVNDVTTAEAAVTAFRSLLKQKKMA